MGTEMRPRSESRLPPLLSLIAGMVDLIAFLTRGNLFTAHITDNSFMDEAAVLACAAQKAGWGRPMPKDVGLGIATTFGQERAMPTCLACVARMRVDRTTGRVAVEKLTMVIDAGTIIHPDSAGAQVEGALLWGLGMALHEGSEFINGQPKDTNLDADRVLRMADVPELEVEFLPSAEVPVWLGEPATTGVAPAIGNAIFAACGARVRHLPIRPATVLEALAHRT
jgi:isoquinoline 1-oxidoreductase beta subunit